VEEGLSLIRAANTGLTFATDPLGRVTASIAPGQMAVLDVRPHERLASTIFAQLRYWPLLIALLACLGISLVVSRRAQRRPS
jgi:apolipoprotein N-acyltransferase